MTGFSSSGASPGESEGTELAESPQPRRGDEVVPTSEGAGRQAVLKFEERSEAE
jgi:hypothetical protein